MADTGSSLSRTESSGGIAGHGCKSWMGDRKCGWGSLTEALWKSYTVELIRTLFFEVLQREADEHGEDPSRIPVLERSDTRTGGYEKLDKIANAATGYRKLEALMSNISLGYGKHVSEAGNTGHSIAG